MPATLYAHGPTPILNSPDLSDIFTQMPRDGAGLMRRLEMIALPGTPFKVKERMTSTVLRIETPSYPTSTHIYIDARFTSKQTYLKPKQPPAPDRIVRSLRSASGLPYLWGGNCSQGISLLRSLYPAPFYQEPLHSLRGLDCSGLLYEATGGHTPRNTSDLLHFGQKVSSLSDVQPLDILVWPGHVIVLVDRSNCIESLLGHGVIETPLERRLKQLGSQSYCIRRLGLCS